MYKAQFTINKAPALAPTKSNTIPSQILKSLTNFMEISTSKESPKGRCKLSKRAKNKVLLLYKNGCKNVGVGEIT